MHTLSCVSVMLPADVRSTLCHHHQSLDDKSSICRDDEDKDANGNQREVLEQKQHY